MAIADPPVSNPPSRRQRRRDNKRRKRVWKATRAPRGIVRAVLRAADVLLDSASFIPAVGALREIKDGTAALLDDAQDIEDGRLPR